MKIIGLSGTNGSGKDTVGEMLAERHGFLFVSVSDLLRDELGRRGLPTERQNMRGLSAEWRRAEGLGVLVDKAVLQAENGDYTGVVMASLRNSGEADRVHELGGTLVWTDADPVVRYGRMYSRKRADDNKTFEQFLAEEAAEMEQSGDAATLNMSAVKDRADVMLANEGNDIESFKDYAEETLKNCEII